MRPSSVVDFEDENDNIFGKLAGYFQNHSFRYRSLLDFKSYSIGFPLISPKTPLRNTQWDMEEAITFYYYSINWTLIQCVLDL